MSPRQIQIPLPETGFEWLEVEAETGACDDVPDLKWIRKPSGPIHLFVFADGPSGSGRFWEIRVGISDKGQPEPARGVCLTTSTVGWRTLQHFKTSPLPWLDDVDGDGKSEFVLWNSFPLRDEGTSAEFGLMAWVYRLASKDSLVVDWELTRRMARELAAAYRAPLKDASPSASQLRAEAAAILEAFAEERCAAPFQNPR